MLKISDKVLNGLYECGIDTEGICERSLGEVQQIIKERNLALTKEKDLKTVDKLIALEMMILSRNF
ncbi:MAG: hypothetical protein E7332_08960 [Clostridiales bacterium]|nr:hypothetical protein [Clostridiales bacterium]